MVKCKNCKILCLVREKDGSQYYWCFRINDNPDVDEERECRSYEVANNSDMIRKMMDEELAEWILEKDDNWKNICKQCKTDTYCEDDSDCKIAILKWLQKEVE